MFDTKELRYQIFYVKSAADRKHFVSGFSKPPASSRFY
jgi:hypothetical protein